MSAKIFYFPLLTFFSFIFSLHSAELVAIDASADLLAQAKECGLLISGNLIKIFSGRAEAISCFKQNKNASKETFLNYPLTTDAPNAEFKIDEKVLYMAKTDFNLHRFLLNHPSYDGRNVVVGVIDDGISPLHSGFKTTSTGKRKYFSHSTFFNYQAIVNAAIFDYLKSPAIGGLYGRI
ncbi:MAG: hypothetical protein A2504_07885 [Bdellovibrionales bacterium RIFOXYD12_FULL_39_22]|nr:MAG: hypothetical protein A2385_11210 [Bdellovibrionales bacterium RIFOXYB1_FULL_39_21]OFZ41252.1 MAG: hypothetical protein A2485_00475 [Bdellovibrionales bacterium RIFOXYC12_FULL_39_17]OFZ45098.1 MAG: hypothetical protein A2404_11505 [Bdellovibrionales bacterium RIFOXYC1_FULL_39_130]OFZ74482.1 MAG: hypothetical protein A2560_11540 [Bdellovibrionales bacterium RIFOXYD1_FULL_39_84]OFZ92494.1 MAG: hypothetical protein A2504_07885 [Bdellovibrionales bacterium RIFOXYD12_FULL_39_22]HLE12440.1 hy